MLYPGAEKGHQDPFSLYLLSLIFFGAGFICRQKPTLTFSQPSYPSVKGGSFFHLHQNNPLIELHLTNYCRVLHFEPIAVAREKYRYVHQTPETESWGEAAFPKGNQKSEEGVTYAGEQTHVFPILTLVSLIAPGTHVCGAPSGLGVSVLILSPGSEPTLLKAAGLGGATSEQTFHKEHLSLSAPQWGTLHSPLQGTLFLTISGHNI